MREEAAHGSAIECAREPHDKRPARKSCGAPSESRPSRKPITASDEHAKPQPKRRQEGHDKGPDYPPTKGERSNQSATKAKNARPPMLRLRQILGLTTGDARVEAKRTC